MNVKQFWQQFLMGGERRRKRGAAEHSNDNLGDTSFSAGWSEVVWTLNATTSMSRVVGTKNAPRCLKNHDFRWDWGTPNHAGTTSHCNSIQHCNLPNVGLVKGEIRPPLFCVHCNFGGKREKSSIHWASSACRGRILEGGLSLYLHSFDSRTKVANKVYNQHRLLAFPH